MSGREEDRREGFPHSSLNNGLQTCCAAVPESWKCSSRCTRWAKMCSVLANVSVFARSEGEIIDKDARVSVIFSHYASNAC